MTWLGNERRSDGGGLPEEQINVIADAAARRAVEIIERDYPSVATVKRLLLGIFGMLVTGLALGGWGAHEYLYSKFAGKEEVLLAGAKADFVLDRQMESIINELAYLERKTNLTNAELVRLQYLRVQLEQMRKVRTGR